MDPRTLEKILLEELEGYTGEGLNDFAYPTANEAEQIYTQDARRSSRGCGGSRLRDSAATTIIRVNERIISLTPTCWRPVESASRRHAENERER